MSKTVEKPPEIPEQKSRQKATIIAAVGKRGTESSLTVSDFDTLTSAIGGTVKAVRLDPQTAVFFNNDAQTATLLDPYALNGVLVLCGTDSNGDPVSLASIKQLTKYTKVFRKPRTMSVVTTDPSQIDILGEFEEV